MKNDEKLLQALRRTQLLSAELMLWYGLTALIAAVLGAAIIF